MKIRLRGKERRCPLCRVRHLSGEAAYVCPGCDVHYHRDCAEELGGCSTLGCKRLGLKPDDAVPEQDRLGSQIRRGLRASRERRRERARFTEEHRQERRDAGQRSSYLPDASSDAMFDAGCCCAMGILELALAGLLMGFLLFPPGHRVASAPDSVAPVTSAAPR